MAEAPILVCDGPPGVVFITLNRPDRRNALNAELLETLCEAITQAEQHPSKRVLVLRGSGSVFCAGLDLQESLDEEVAEHNAHRVLKTLRTIARTRLITIASVQGAAMAGGAGIMSACDFALAANDVKIGFPEVHRGLVAALVMSFIARNVPGRDVRSLLLRGQPIDANEAQAIGLINEAVPRDELELRVLKLAGEILLAAPAAVERTKRLLERLSPWNLDDDLDMDLRQHMDARGSLEAKEGLAAFLEKRPPMWQTHVKENEP